jgi:hypothetical protein
MFDTKLPWNLDHHRYVVLGFPRSGTQLLESFIKYSLSEQHDNVVALQEIFTRHTVLIDTIVLEDNQVKIHNYSNVTYADMSSAADQRLNVIKNGDPNQPMICRMFLDDGLATVTFTQGIEYLKNLNFKFVYIERRFDHTIISGMFAWKSFIWNGVKNNMTLKIDIDELKNFIVSRYLVRHRQFKLMQKLVPNYHIMNYDDLVDKASSLSPMEREKAFGIYQLKQLNLDPYEQIENSDEVRQVFAEFYPKVQSLTNDLLN